MSAFWDFIDRRAIVRRIMTLGTFYLVVENLHWSYVFATTSPRNGMEVAAILGAVGTPLSLLMGFLFNSYKDSRKGM